MNLENYKVRVRPARARYFRFVESDPAPTVCTVERLSSSIRVVLIECFLSFDSAWKRGNIEGLLKCQGPPEEHSA